MGLSTFETLRDLQLDTIEALTPAEHAGVKFARDDADADFEVWCEANPTACFRRFTILDEFDYEDPTLNVSDLKEVRGREVIIVAYPEDKRYGLDNARDRKDVMRQDLHQIDDAVGIAATVYSDHFTQHRTIEHADLEAVSLMIIGYTFEYRKART